MGVTCDTATTCRRLSQSAPANLITIPNMGLRSYKMTVDTGFAPNPYGRTLTLATCKPDMRKCVQEGEWIAGFTSSKMCGHKVGEERLVYLMRVAKKLHVRDYFSDPGFEDKIPDLDTNSREAQAGDNIYRPLVSNANSSEDFEQLENPNHVARDRKWDIDGEWVLVADEFYYFGKSAIALPGRMRPEVPLGQSRYGQLTCSDRSERFLRYVRNGYGVGRHGHPHQTPRACQPRRSMCT